jgi:hypothetical protein
LELHDPQQQQLTITIMMWIIVITMRIIIIWLTLLIRWMSIVSIQTEGHSRPRPSRFGSSIKLGTASMRPRTIVILTEVGLWRKKDSIFWIIILLPATITCSILAGEIMFSH